MKSEFLALPNLHVLYDIFLKNHEMPCHMWKSKFLKWLFDMIVTYNSGANFAECFQTKW